MIHTRSPGLYRIVENRYAARSFIATNRGQWPNGHSWWSIVLPSERATPAASERRHKKRELKKALCLIPGSHNIVQSESRELTPGRAQWRLIDDCDTFLLSLCYINTKRPPNRLIITRVIHFYTERSHIMCSFARHML